LPRKKIMIFKTTIMKRFLVLGAALALLASCSDDDKATTVNMDELVGKAWYPAAVNANGETELYDGHVQCGINLQEDSIEFNSNGTVTEIDVTGCNGSNPVSTTYTADYTVSGRKITISQDENTTVIYTVKTLTETQLVVSYPGDYDGDDDEETITVTYTSVQ